MFLALMSGNLFRPYGVGPNGPVFGVARYLNVSGNVSALTDRLSQSRYRSAPESSNAISDGDH
jgi:hypothetical protein